jgi:hypothetical protein
MTQILNDEGGWVRDGLSSYIFNRG